MGRVFLEEHVHYDSAVMLPVGTNFTVRVKAISASYRNARGEKYVKPLWGNFNLGKLYKAVVCIDGIAVFDNIQEKSIYTNAVDDWRQPNASPPLLAFFDVVSGVWEENRQVLGGEGQKAVEEKPKTFSITVTGTIGEDGQIDITTEASGAPIVTFIGALEVAKRDLYKQGGAR